MPVKAVGKPRSSPERTRRYRERRRHGLCPAIIYLSGVELNVLIATGYLALEERGTPKP
jgi:hypothetical protein